MKRSHLILSISFALLTVAITASGISIWMVDRALRNAYSARRLSDISRGLLYYAEENAGALPPHASWQDDLVAAGWTLAADLYSPISHDPTSVDFLRTTATSIPTSGVVAILYERPDLRSGPGHVAFSDGSVRFLLDDEFAEAITGRTYDRPPGIPAPMP